MPVNENRLREIVLAEIDAELDKSYNPDNDSDIVLFLKEQWQEGRKDRGWVYAKTKEITAQLIRLMMDIARG